MINTSIFTAFWYYYFTVIYLSISVRVFYFKHAAPQLFISSADWMPRNLVRRIELLSGIEDPESAEKLLSMLRLQVSDNVLSHELQSDGSYHRVTNDKSKIINNQRLFESHTNKVYKSLKKDTANYVQKLAIRLMKES